MTIEIDTVLTLEIIGLSPRFTMPVFSTYRPGLELVLIDAFIRHSRIFHGKAQ
ncbi:MAG: hypothetical protein JNK47_17310 [Mesorhizobium sp.]|nr:hypothetical protein [Mesorhizobium sp.]MBL8578980.1 hypothetical protein [Mesorhizobium sp.]